MRPRLGAVLAWLALGAAPGLPLAAQEKAPVKPEAPQIEEKAPALKSEAPRIAVEPASFDFGLVLQDRTLTKEFSVRNFGKAELRIQNISTTCGCAAALLDAKTLAAGASSRLRVTLETRSATGPVRRSVLIRSNDPEQELLELKLLATVRPDPAPKR